MGGAGAGRGQGLSFAEALQRDGFVRLAGVLPVEGASVEVALPAGAVGGSRCLLDQPWCASLAQRLRAHEQIAPLLPPEAVAVQCTYFEKSSGRNWLVALHQDLSIPIAERVTAVGWRGESTKEGQLFMQPPSSVLSALVALRLHVDPCGPADGALRFVPGSHRWGVLDGKAARELRDSGKEQVCLADVGDVIAMKPLVLHASSKARGLSRRRVLHFLYGGPTLPDGAAWARRV